MKKFPFIIAICALGIMCFAFIAAFNRKKNSDENFKANKADPNSNNI